MMSDKRAQQLRDGLNGTARKVLDSVPIEAAWSLRAICGDCLRRQLGMSMEMVEGSLKVLVQLGLVTCRNGGQYRQAPTRPLGAAAPAPWAGVPVAAPAAGQTAGATMAEKTTADAVAAAQTAAQTLIAQFGAYSKQAADAAAQLQRLAVVMAQLADDIETTALAAVQRQEEEQAATAGDLQDLQQLRTLLHNIGARRP